MAGRRRGRTGRGWDASPPRARRFPGESSDELGQAAGAVNDAPDAMPGGELGSGEGRLDENGWPIGSVPVGRRPAGTASRRWSGRSARGGSRGADPPADEAQSEKDPAERAREICLRLLAVRPRTRAELATAMKQRGVEADVAAEVLERYGEVGIIDDAAFARAWVTSRHYGRGLGGRALATELRRKGVDSEAVGAALAELDRDTETATARAMVERKLRGDRGGSPDAVVRRLVGMLARKGYPPALAVRVVREVLAERAGSGDAQDLDSASSDSELAEFLEAEAAAADVEGAEPPHA